jgi:hypothetical protein
MKCRAGRRPFVDIHEEHNQQHFYEQTRRPRTARQTPAGWPQIAQPCEALFLKEPGLTSELLEELGRADTATLAKLFGVSALPSAEQPPVELLSAKPGPTWSSPVSESPSRRDEEPRWDSNGYRLNPPPRNVFPRHERPRGTHWSR